MSERWTPQPMKVVQWGQPYHWLAINEMGEVEHFDRHHVAVEWVFGNWDFCATCEAYVPWHPEHNACRGCGRRWDDAESQYMLTVAGLTTALLDVRFERGDPDRIEQITNYRLDAEDVVAMLPHLLDLDVREALFGDLEEEENDA